MIRPGDCIRFEVAFKTAVHHDCERAVTALADRATAAEALEVELGPATGGELPHGLKPGTLSTYVAEWSRYVDFAVRLGFVPLVPGKDVDWVPYLLWRFMLFRAERCKPTTVFSHLSALAHFGHRHRFLLPTKKSDGRPLLHRDIACMKNEIALYYCRRKGIKGLTYDVQHSTPLGHDAIELVASAFRLVDEAAFNRLTREDAHNIAASMLQHGAAMRFGHFLYRDYTVKSFTRGADAVFRLPTDWHRYQGQRRYVLAFAENPRWQCLRYVVRGQDGSELAHLTAAKVLTWHIRRLQRAGEVHIFRPEKGGRPSRTRHRRWLQRVLWAALPLDEQAAREMVADVTPHAFRAGLAGDLHDEDVPWQTIAMWCRWHSMRAMRMYASRPALRTARTSRRFRFIPVRV